MKPYWKTWFFLAVSLLAFALAFNTQGKGIASSSLQAESKIEALLLEKLSAEGQADFFVWMTEKADLSPAASLPTKQAKGQFVFETLRETADRTQKDLRAYLDAQGVEYTAFYIANKIYVNSGNTALVTTLANRSDVAHITANHAFQLQEPFISERAPETVGSNIAFVKADQVWALGYTGAGVVLAGNDTGLDWDHPAIINQYRGWNGSSANHNYNWWDATGTYPTVPDDGHGHGTHTTGTMVGDDGGTNQIGVAPGAKTVHCKNMTNGGSGSDLTFTTCFQWDLAPWDLTGSNPMPSLAPDAINNSWGYFGGGATQFIDEVDALRAAGIVVEVSAGNEGSSCGTLRSPGDYAQSLTTGSVNHVSGTLPGTLTGFSSRGPSSIHPGSFIPDIMAPGENINSSLPGGGYSGPTWSGTSMAGPHVTALVALMWDASPGIVGDVALTEQIMIETAVPLTGQSGSNCGGDYTTGPNNDWGYGTMDALAAVQEAIVQGGPFSLDVDPDQLAICTPADAVFDIDVLLNQPGFSDPVTLSVTGNPGGTTTNFSTNPVTPPGSSTLTIGNTGAASAGNYPLSIIGTAPTSTFTATVTLDVFTGLPGVPTLVSPSDGATGVSLVPTLQWNSATQGHTYALEVATDAGFSNVVYSASSIAGTQHTLASALNQLTTYYWHVRADNACGGGTYSTTFSFTTTSVPPILLVDDDDNGPNVQATYTTALDNLGLSYDVWDTNNTDNEPTATDLVPYQAVIWFTGDEFGGTAGPGGAGETALGNWLDNGGCLFISSQDYHWDRGLTSFMTSYLGASTISDDNGDYTSVTGQGSVFGGLGPYSLTYPFTDFSDRITASGSAELAFQGNNGFGAAVNKDSGVYKTTFWVFPWEAINTAAGRETTLQTFIDWCDISSTSGTLSGTVTDVDTGDPIAGATVTAVGPETKSATTNGSGFYSMNILAGDYDVTASATNYLPATETDVTIVVATTTTLNFALVSTLPEITVDPDSFTPTYGQGSVVTVSMTIGNNGIDDLDWSIAEEAPLSLPALPVVLPTFASGNPADAAETVGVTAPAGASTPAALSNFVVPTGSVLYDNGPLTTHPGGGSGGANASALQTALGMGIYGFGHAVSSGFRVADNFTVPAGGWTIDSVIFYAYQTGSGITPTINAVNLRIWDGPPNAGGNIIFGDTSTNRLTNTVWSNIYRTLDTDLTNTQRPVMANTAGLGGLYLPEGTYWLDWQTGGTLASGPWAPPVTVLGSTGTGNALQWDGSTWTPVVDIGPQDFPFQLIGSAAPLVCSSPSDIPWLNVSPTSGTTTGGSSSDVDVTFDTTSLSTGIYTGTLCISSNDPVTPLVVVPITLTVETPSYGVSVGADQAGSSAPGETITYTVEVNNTGNVPDTYDLTLVSGWTGDLSATSVTVNPGSSATVWVTVEVPAGALAGDSDTATITATSQGDGSITDSADLTSTAEAVYGVTLSADQAQTGPAGSTVTYEVTITNSGNLTDTFDLEATGVWAALLSDTSVTLGAGESATFTVEVDVPGSAADGDSDVTTVTATSQTDASVTDSTDLTTTAGTISFSVYLPVVVNE